MAVVGWFTTKEIIPLGIYMLMGSFFQFFGDPARLSVFGYHWFVLGGAAFATIGFLGRSAIVHFVGNAFMVTMLGAFITGADLFWASIVGSMIVVGGIAFMWAYMYRTLGGAPKVGEILTLAARTLFTYGLKRPLNQYRLVAIAVQGNVGTEQIANELLTKLEPTWRPIVLLGPTAPTQVRLPAGARVGWVTSLSGVETRDYSITFPE